MSSRIADIIAEYPHLAQLAHEDAIDLDDFPLLQPYGEVEIVDCKYVLKINNDPVTDYQIGEIPYTAFTWLFEKANNMREFGLSYVTALKFAFALDANDALCTLCQPLYMKAVGNPSNGEQQYEIVEDVYYIFDVTSNGFRAASNPEKSMMNNYAQTINILHFGDASHQPHRSTDTDAVIFPFQEIFALILDNKGFSTNTVKIFSSVRRLVEDGEIEVYHNMLLSIDIPPPLEKSFYQRYANRSNLCPPDCDGFKYKIV